MRPAFSRPRPGTLYGALDRLAEQGLVEIDREEAVDGRLRRYDKLTDSGATALAAQADRLCRHADAAETGLRRLHGRLAFGRRPAGAGHRALVPGPDPGQPPGPAVGGGGWSRRP